MSHVVKISPEGESLIQGFEALRLRAYLDSAGIPTIGWGTIRYPDGRKVKMGDTCTVEQATEYFRHDLSGRELAVDALMVDSITQRQFDALLSFAYNNGTTGLKDSTLRRRVNANPDDPAIRAAFMMWYKARDPKTGQLKKVRGLWIRRHHEADYYFGVSTPVPEMP